MEEVKPMKDRAAVIAIPDCLWRWNPTYCLVFEFGVPTGLRVSDIRRLRFSNIIEDHPSCRRRWAEKTGILEQETRKTGKKPDNEGNDLRKTKTHQAASQPG